MARAGSNPRKTQESSSSRARRPSSSQQSPAAGQAALDPSEITRTEIVVDMEDRPGVLASVGEILGEANVNIVAAAAFSTKGRGVVHLVVDDSAGALAAFKRAKVPVSTVREVMAVTVEDKPGELGRFARSLADRNINISALYIAGERWGEKEFIIAIEEPKGPLKAPN